MESDFVALKAEHFEITCCWKKAQEAFAQGEISIGVEALKTLELKIQEHYQHEDELLFSKVFENPLLSQGGPFCTLYYDSFLHSRPLRQLHSLVRRVDPQFEVPRYTGVAEKYVVKGSPLAIPNEEHLAILSLTNNLIRLLGQSPELNSVWREQALSQLGTWIRANHEKEENCLFTHIRNILKVC